MPSINIRETDLTSPGQLNVLSNTVYVPGVAKKLPADFKEGTPRLYTSLQAFQDDFGSKVPKIGGLYASTDDATEGYYINAWKDSGFSYDTGYIYATELLRFGVPVLYDCLLECDEDGYVLKVDVDGNPTEIKSKNEIDNIKDVLYIQPKDDDNFMYEGISNKIVSHLSDASNNTNKLLLDKGLYNIKFVSNGGYANSGINSALQAFVGDGSSSKRNDCVAILDHPFNQTFTGLINNVKSAYASDSKTSKYCAMFTPWALYSPTCIQNYKNKVENGKQLYYPDTIMLPASFGYLMAMASSTSAGANNWVAYAGASRGNIPFLQNLYEEITQSQIDELQKRDSVSVNPIATINPFGVIVWGNRTLFDNSINGNLTASSFLNIRNLCSDVKKTVWTAARQITFEPNSTLLWIKFKSLIIPTLDKMVSGGGLSGYELIKEVSKEKAKLTAKIRLYAIEAVEDFDITIELADDTTAITE